jgi:hypothetical protein
VTTTAPSRRFTGDFRADVLVALIIALALLAGYVYQRSLAARVTRVSDPNSGFALSVPSDWAVNEELPPDTFLAAYDPQADSVYKSTITAQSFALDPENPAGIEDIVNGIVARHGEELLGYQLLDIQPATLAGVEARTIHYAYVEQPIDEPFMASPPVVVIATDHVVYTASEYWVLTLTADEKIAEDAALTFDTILRSISLP